MSTSFAPTLDSVFDGLYYGFVISTVLFGVTTVQAWIYIKTNKDGWLLRLLVTALVLLDFATTFLNSEIVRYYLLSNYGNLIALETITPTLKTEILLSFIVVFIVNLFFASRIYLLRQIHWLMALLIVVIAIGAAVAGLIVVIGLFRGTELSLLTNSNSSVRVAFYVSLALSAAAEVVSTIVLSYSLHISRTGFRSTDGMIKKIFHYIVARGALLAAFQLLTLIMFTTKANTLDWIPLHFILTRLYVITVVAMLNARLEIRRQSGNDSEIYTNVLNMESSSFHAHATYPGDMYTNGSRVYIPPAASSSALSN